MNETSTQSPAPETLQPSEAGELPQEARLRLQTHRYLLVISLLVVLAAATLDVTPDDLGVSVFGWRVPEVCAAKRLGGDCPGCGLTRSFVYGAHGDLVGSFRLNALGPLLFLLVASQIPFRAFRLWRAWSLQRRGILDMALFNDNSRWTQAFWLSVVGLLFAAWVVRSVWPWLTG